MNHPKSPLVIAISTLLGLGASTPLHAEELGVIRVDSTTIDDRFEAKRDEPSSTSVIAGEEVDRAHVENLQQMLQGVPGITTEVQNGDSIKIHIRGVENQVFMGEKPGVAVVIDGVPVFERTGRVNIDLDNIESIRVVKGGASWLYGDDALAGAVIITTKRGAGMAGTRVSGEAGSFNSKRGLVRVGSAGDNYSAHLQASTRSTDGYYDDSASHANYLNGKWQYYLSDVSDVTVGFELADRAKGSHGTVTGVTAAETDPTSEDPAYDDYANHYDVELAKFFVTYARDVGEADNLLLNVYQFSDRTQYLSSPIDTIEDGYNYDNDYLQYQRGVKGEYRHAGQQAWMVGGELRDNSYDNEVAFIDCTGMGVWSGCSVGSLYNDNSTAERVQALYGEYKFQPARDWTVTLNGRYDHIDLDYSDDLDPAKSGDKAFDVSSWRLGLNRALGESRDLYSNLSTGFRAPSVTQLFVGSGNPTSRIAPNPDLVPEYSLNLDIGMRGRGAWGSMPVEYDVSVFQLERYDHIQATAGQYTTDPLSENIYDNIGDVRNRGLELTLIGQPSQRTRWDLAYTYLESHYTAYDTFYLQTGGWATTYTPYDNTGNEVPRVPRHHLNLALTRQLTGQWSVTGEVDAVTGYWADEINQEWVDGHEVVNLLINYDRTASGTAWNAFLRIDNLFDQDYYNTARGYRDSNEDGVYDEEDLSITVNPGRVFTAGLSARF